MDVVVVDYLTLRYCTTPHYTTHTLLNYTTLHYTALHCALHFDVFEVEVCLDHSRIRLLSLDGVGLISWWCFGVCHQFCMVIGLAGFLVKGVSGRRACMDACIGWLSASFPISH
jgi:hypothetical protein